MAVRGRYGITRDDDGSLSSFERWPWYWRYPGAFLGVLASLAAAVWWSETHVNAWKVSASIAVVGSLAALCLVPEVLILGFLAGLLAGFVWISTTVLYFFFPGLESWGKSSMGWQWWVACGLIAYLYASKRALESRVAALEKSNAALWGRISP